ncbi:olfactory receptor 14J1-like [Athene noctua]|uniref:olfactory receptor 14J1-like n=1 Tax=Athene noctua TaxID=126797 RepID=UPI003EBBC4F9
MASGIECTFNKCANDTELCGAADALDGRDVPSRGPEEATRVIRCLEHLSSEDRLRRLGMFMPEKRKLTGGLLEAFQCFKKADRKDVEGLFIREWRDGKRAEFSLLTIMSYDRYVAICKPLHYGTLLGSRACVHMAAAAWGTGFLNSLLHTANTFSLPLCQGNTLDQFFCEIPQILKLSCSHSYLREVGLIMVSACLAFGCFVFIVVSYVQIFRAVLRIPSEQGRHKAFSTCLPHLAVVSLFISTGTFANLKSPSLSSPSLDLAVSFLYSVVPPAVNPLIYSMRNQELKQTLKKLIQSAAELSCLTMDIECPLQTPRGI